MNMNDPQDCPKRMETPIRVLEHHKARAVSREQKDQLTRAIALLKAHESMCECGTMPGDGNAALWDLERSLEVHKDMHTAFHGTPKGQYHARCIREIDAAIHAINVSLSCSPLHPERLVFDEVVDEETSRKQVSEIVRRLKETVDPTKTSNLTFSEALDAVKRGKTVGRPLGLMIYHKAPHEFHPTASDMMATDWFVVEDGK